MHDRRHLLKLAAAAAALPSLALAGPPAHVRVVKHQRLMEVAAGGKLWTFRVSLGARPVGRKQRQGDLRTPEGLYRVTARNPYSQYHRSLLLSYPEPQDRARAALMGVDPGGDIAIHGLSDRARAWGELHWWRDWTFGCIAVTDAEIELLWDIVPIGSSVEILA